MEGTSYYKIWAGYNSSLSWLDTETGGSTAYINPRALGCSDPRAAGALLKALGFINAVDPEGLSA